MPLRVIRREGPPPAPASEVVTPRGKFPPRLRDIVLRLPPIGMTGDKKSIILKYITPNQHRFFTLYGYPCRFVPAYSSPIFGAPGHASIIAVILALSTAERPGAAGPSLRISEPDISLWPDIIDAYMSRVRKSYTPGRPEL